MNSYVPSNAVIAHAERLREREAGVRETLDGNAPSLLVRQLVTDGVQAAEALEAYGMPAGELFDRCMELKGEPWGQARARRDMRERVRVVRALQEGVPVPKTAEELIALWARANEGEVAWYTEAEQARFRTQGTPFGHGAAPFEEASPPPGYETASPADIPREVEKLLAFLGSEDVPVEARAGAAHFYHGHIHPFRDGNGHTARMLACLVLAKAYSAPTLLALLRRLQRERKEMAETMARTVRGEGSLDSVVLLFLRLMGDAQEDALRRCQ